MEKALGENSEIQKPGDKKRAPHRLKNCREVKMESEPHAFHVHGMLGDFGKSRCSEEGKVEAR